MQILSVVGDNMYSIKLYQIQNNKLSLVDHPLSLDEDNPELELQLQSIPGSSAMHLQFLKEKETVLRLEVGLEDRQGDSVDVVVALTGDADLRVDIHNHKVFTLPVDYDFSPVLIPPPSDEQKSLDIAILIDATMRQFSDTTVDAGKEVKVPWYTKLLLNTEAWTENVDKICQLIESLHEHYTDCKVSVIAFGDSPPPNASAKDLIPIYKLFPEDRRFQKYAPEKLKTTLHKLEASSGGDIVDALADGLDACSQLAWRTKARKLLLLWGDSPGYSVLNPAPMNMDMHIRCLDVDTAIMQLHSKGAEVLTVYQRPPQELYEYYDGNKDKGDNRHVLGFLDYTEKQYKALASLPEMATYECQFLTDNIVKLLADRQVIARNGAFGELKS